jgi:hypothetical protein
MATGQQLVFLIRTEQQNKALAIISRPSPKRILPAAHSVSDCFPSILLEQWITTPVYAFCGFYHDEKGSP